MEHLGNARHLLCLLENFLRKMFKNVPGPNDKNIPSLDRKFVIKYIFKDSIYRNCYTNFWNSFSCNSKTFSCPFYGTGSFSTGSGPIPTKSGDFLTGSGPFLTGSVFFLSESESNFSKSLIRKVLSSNFSSFLQIKQNTFKKKNCVWKLLILLMHGRMPDH